MPRRGRKVLEVLDDDVRELLVDDYRVVYKVNDHLSRVELLVVAPARRPFDPTAVLDD